MALLREVRARCSPEKNFEEFHQELIESSGDGKSYSHPVCDEAAPELQRGSFSALEMPEIRATNNRGFARISIASSPANFLANTL